MNCISSNEYLICPLCHQFCNKHVLFCIQLVWFQPLFFVTGFWISLAIWFLPEGLLCFFKYYNFFLLKIIILFLVCLFFYSAIRKILWSLFIINILLLLGRKIKMNTITNIHYLNLRNVNKLSQLQQPLLRSEGQTSHGLWMININKCKRQDFSCNVMQKLEKSSKGVVRRFQLYTQSAETWWLQ